jgi:hypothetical protein
MIVIGEVPPWQSSVSQQVVSAVSRVYADEHHHCRDASAPQL